MRQVIGLLATTLLTLAACSQADPNQLEREVAQALVQAKIGERLPDKGCYALRKGGWQEGINQGYWTQWFVTETGQPLIVEVNQQRVCLKSKVAQPLEITGVADSSMPGYKSIEFRLSNNEVPDPMRRFIVAGYRGVALARRYDDGWRIEDAVRYEPENAPLLLTSGQQKAADSDLNATTTRRQEAERFDADRQSQFDALIEDSRKPKQAMQTFHCDTLIGDRRNTIDLSVNDVQIVKTAKTFDRSGRGGVSGTSTYPYGHIPSLKFEGEWLMLEQQNAGSGTHFMYFYPSQCPNYVTVEAAIRKNHQGWWARFDQVGSRQ